MNNEKLRVLSNAIIIWNGPNNTFDKIGSLFKNETFEVIERNGTWVKMDRGWVNTVNRIGTNLTIAVPDEEEIEEPSFMSTRAAETVPVKSDIPDWYIYEVSSTATEGNTDNYTNYITSHMDTDNAIGIHGIPYQFLPSADMRLDGSNNLGSFGRKFGEKIITQMPLALLAPGVPKFMPTYSSDDKKSMVSSLIDSIADHSLGGMLKSNDDVLNREGRYYDFVNKLIPYYDHVDPMCRAAATYLGLGDVEIGDGGKLGSSWTWWRNKNSKVHGLLNVQQCVAFYCDSETSVSESWSNNTGESMLASKVNSISDQARELNFLMGNTFSAIGARADVLSEDVNSSIQEFDKLLDDITGSNFLKTVGSKAITVASGAKMIFPEIWQDSDYSKPSATFKFKFVSPDPDPLSIYLNCLVPTLHCLGFVAPRQVVDEANAYQSPYLVRGYYKGVSSIDMGIVTSMSISKGAEGAWTVDGLPTVIEVSMDIKDLYSTFMMTYCGKDWLNPRGTLAMADNIMLMSWIANLCGININKPDLTRKADLWTSIISGNISDIFSKSIFARLESDLVSKMMQIYRSF